GPAPAAPFSWMPGYCSRGWASPCSRAELTEMGGAAARAAGQVGLGARACDDRTGVASASERSAASRREPLRILLHDYCGHPFQFQLAVELASRGHDVVHAY